MRDHPFVNHGTTNVAMVETVALKCCDFDSDIPGKENEVGEEVFC